VRVHVVDPSAYTPPYDHALCTALAREGIDVELFTSHFAYGGVPAPDGYARHELFYSLAPGAEGARLRRAAKLAQHVPDMLRYRRAAHAADVVHFQWLTIQHLDAALLPRGRPMVLTAHDVLPFEPRTGQRAAQRRLYGRVDAVVVHSDHGRRRLTAELGVPPERVAVIPHPAFDHLTRLPYEKPLPAELAAVTTPVVLCFGLIRPRKGIDVLVEAWRGVEGAELWIVGRPRMDTAALRAAAPASARFVERFVDDAEIPALFRRAALVVLPYLEAEQSGVLATALAFARPVLATAVGGFEEVAGLGAAETVPPGDPAALTAAIGRLLADPARREELSRGAAAAAAGPYSWAAAARAHVELYGRLAPMSALATG
jgi:glycosyltransferase involved in cell wall biosynthesis